MKVTSPMSCFLNKAVDLFEEKHPGVLGMFIFDNAPSNVVNLSGGRL